MYIKSKRNNYSRSWMHKMKGPPLGRLSVINGFYCGELKVLNDIVSDASLEDHIM